MDGGRSMKHRIGLAVASLHIIAALSLLVLVLLACLCGDDAIFGPPALFFSPFLVLPAICSELTVAGLHKRRHWARQLGIGLFGPSLISPLFPLGIMGLMGLCDTNSRAEFGIAMRDDDLHLPW
jgi:hypothetical protein